MTTFSTLTHPGKTATDDRPLVKAIGGHLRQADVHIFQYGLKTDFKFIQTKLVHYGFEPLPSLPMIIDTHRIAKQKLSLVSNSLRELARFFKLKEQKMEITAEQWFLAFAGDKPTLRLIERRCASDVRVTEQVYLKLRALDTNHPNLSLLERNDLTGCPNCGTSVPMLSNGIRATSKKVYRRFSCRVCGAWSKGEVIKEGKNNA